MINPAQIQAMQANTGAGPMTTPQKQAGMYQNGGAVTPPPMTGTPPPQGNVPTVPQPPPGSNFGAPAVPAPPQGPNAPWLGTGPVQPPAQYAPPTGPTQSPGLGEGGAGGGQGGNVPKLPQQNMGDYGNITPEMADYESVQQYADQAYDASRRYLDPQQDMMMKRHEQSLVNKGIDPGSEQGQEMLSQMQRQISDQNSAASFGALQMGQGVQNQMFGQANALNQNALAARGQDLQRYLGQIGGNTQRYLGELSSDTARYGQDLQYQLGQSGQDMQRYLGDLSHTAALRGQDLNRYQGDQQYKLGQGQLDMNKQQQDFMQMMGLEGLDFRDKQYADAQGRYQDQLLMAMLGMNQAPGAVPIDPSGAFGGTLTPDKGLLGGAW